jgi:hypothetical protein
MVTRFLCLLFLLALSASAQTPRIPPPENVNRNGLVGRFVNVGYKAQSNEYDIVISSDPKRSGRLTSSYWPTYSLMFGRESVSFNAHALSAYNGGITYTNSFPLTMSSWFYFTALDSGNIFYFGSSGSIPLLLVQRASSPPRMRVYVNNIYLFSTEIPTNRWFHFAITRGPTGTGHMWVNGQQSTAITQTAAAPSQSASLRFSNAGWFQHDTRIYNRALSAAEIAAIYRGLQ